MPRITAIFLSCSVASIVTKFASLKRDFAMASSFFASRIGMEIMFAPLTFFVPGPNIGCIQIGVTLSGILESAETVFVFKDDMSIKQDSLFISFAMSRMISGVLFVGVQSIT